MKILAHRGYWIDPSEKNTLLAFKRAADNGFGIETDFRDYCGELAISHDPASYDSIKIEEFIGLIGGEVTCAINIKADGLAIQVRDILMKGVSKDSFVFDMSIPDTIAHISAGNRVFSRLSEFERISPLFEKCNGIWLDAFESDWYGIKEISNLLEDGFEVCVVSNELHGRHYADQWKMINTLPDKSNLMLCTDHPMEARKYFMEN